jgi:REP element-mobilizing transposase RayT
LTEDILMTQKPDLPQRHKLPHAIPLWVGQGVRHFITINCQVRGHDSLCKGNVPNELLSSARHYEKIGRWYLWLMVIMPDHVHLIATFDLEHGIQATIKGWKGYQKRNLNIEWQADYFEHRLRNEDEFIEKMHYVRMNPVRKELVPSPSEWPHVFDRSDLAKKSGMIIGRARRPCRAARQDGSAGGFALPEGKEIGDA